MTPQPLRAALMALTVLGVCALVPALASWPARAETQPGASIKFLVTHAAGGLPDTVARIVGKRLQERLGQTIVVENRTGANGGIAVAALTSAPADGLTFVVTDGAILSTNPLLYNKLPYEPKDVAPVAFLAQAPLFLAAHADVPVKSLQEFIDYAKARPGQLNFGSSGVGSIHHISMEALMAALNLKLTHVPYRGTGESVPALLGGHVNVLFSAYPSLSGAANTNLIKLLASNAAGRSSLAPNVPAIAEIIPDFNFAPIVGIYGRVGTPPAIMQKIAAEATATVKEPEVMQALAVVGVESTGGGPEEFGRALQGEIDRVAKVIKTVGIRIE
jgi:tripartite-type tricarboxylate transporter receptor subunit TctC